MAPDRGLTVAAAQTTGCHFRSDYIAKTPKSIFELQAWSGEVGPQTFQAVIWKHSPKDICGHECGKESRKIWRRPTGLAEIEVGSPAESAKQWSLCVAGQSQGS
jgi:hypothetical protein